jgi:predicted nucleic acid-binding protein
MPILVDSSVWINHFRGFVTPAVARFRAHLTSTQNQILVADLIAHEVTRGCKTDREYEQTLAVFDSIECVNLGGLIQGQRAAKLYRAMRSKGITVAKTVDLLIASWCIHEHVHLLHDDRDFDDFVEYGLTLA